MRYTAEFKIPLDVVGMDKDIEGRIEWMKEAAAYNLGKLIGEKTDWQELPGDGNRFRLSVQAFSDKDWLDFKKTFTDKIFSGLLVLGRPEINKLFLDFESKMMFEIENKTKE